MLRQTIAFQTAQPSMHYLEKHLPGTTINHLCMVVDVMGDLNVDILTKSLLQLQARHEVLRASVLEQDDKAFLQVNDDTPAVQLTLLNGTLLPSTQPFQESLKQLQAERWLLEPFQLSQSPLWRCALLKLGDQHYQFALLFNALIVDRAAADIVLRDLSYFYNGLQHTLPALTSQQHALPLTNEETKKRIQYWKSNLDNMHLLTLPTDRVANGPFQFRGQRLSFSVSPSWKQHSFLNDAALSMRVIFLAAFYTVLARHSDENDICIGSIVGLHERRIQSNQVNSFFNSVALRLQCQKSLSFRELCLHIAKIEAQAIANELPLDQIVQHALGRQTRAALRIASPFTVLLSYHEEAARLSIPGLTITQPFELSLGDCKLPDFSLNIVRNDEGNFLGYLDFNSQCFSAEAMQKFIHHFNAALDYAAQHLDYPHAMIPLLHEKEINAINAYNATELTPIYRDHVHAYLHHLAQVYPAKQALCFHSETHHVSRLTYAQWDYESNQLAHYLLARGLKSGDRVGASLSRSFNLFIALFAVLKAGGVWVPLETQEDGMLSHKMNDANLNLLLTDSNTTALFTRYNLVQINLHNLQVINAISLASTAYDFPAIDDQQIAYIMYTSGTTGQTPIPKGIMITHAGFNNLLNALLVHRTYAPCNVIMIANFTFDASHHDILIAFSNAGTLHFADKGQFSPEFISRMIRQESITYGVFLPEMLAALDPALPLQHIVTMGAMVNEENLSQWHKLHPYLIIENGYGLTETTIRLTAEFSSGAYSTLIGRPIANMKIFILDSDTLTLSPLGVIGEMFASGPGLAEGYLNNPQLTATQFRYACFDKDRQCFLPCSANTPGAMRLFATGDYASFQLMRNDTLKIRYIGRRDRQEKLNGVRIDLNYVENWLRKDSNIKDVVVLVNSQKTALKAFIVLRDEKLTLDHILASIRERFAKYPLPSIALPQQFFMLDSLPLTPNHKIDFRVLAVRPDGIPPKLLTTHSPLRQLLISIWAQVLACNPEEIDVKSTFKALGGHSLSLKTLESLINTRMGVPRTLSASESKMPGFVLNQKISLTARPEELTIEGLANFLKPFLNAPTFGLPENVIASAGVITFYKKPPAASSAATKTKEFTASYKH